MTPQQESEQEVQVGPHVVCLIDLLAQKDFLKQWTVTPIPMPLPPTFLAGIKKTAGTVECFREMFAKHFRESSQLPPAPDTMQPLSQSQKDLITRINDCPLGIHGFSDTFVFHSPFQTKHKDITILPLFSMLVSCCWAMVLSLAAKVPLRGVICIGNGLQLLAGDFYGPALAEADQIQKYSVGHPRIVLSTETAKNVYGERVFSTQPVIEAVMQEMKEKCMGLLCKDDDGQVIVDYLGEASHKFALEYGESEYLKAVENAYRFVISEQSRFQGNDLKHYARYSLVRHYMDARLPIWGLQHLSEQIF